MDNSDATEGHAMTPQEFAKLMGAYPQPAENPLPAYGGYMDNSPANFSFVEFNDYFGAENEIDRYYEHLEEILEVKARLLKENENGELYIYNPDQEAENDAIYEVLSKYYPEVYGAETFEANPNYYRKSQVGIPSPMGEFRKIKADDKLHAWATTMLSDVKLLIEDLENGAVYDLDDCRERLEKIRDDTSHLDAETFEAPYAGAGSLFSIGQNTGLEGFTTSELTTSSAIHGDFDEASLNYSGHQNFEVRAEMDMIDDSNARIRNRFGDEIGMVSVDDHDVEDAVVEVSDGSDVIQEVIVSESETVKKSLLPLALGALAAVVAFPTVTSLFTKKEEKAAETPELIESPDTGNLDPAQYEELVVESTGYAVDVIPQGLDGSFMGSRFAALPTERYVDYNEPGIGAHTDIALNRDEIYLEPEMAMVQASENVIKEAQAPGQSPYNSMTGEENPDFDFRVVKETQVISLDPAVKPFIPQSMSGYTGNANTPPSVLNKMFNTGVLGQTPAFVPGSGDIGASHTGSRNATPNALGLGGSVGGPLSDQVNASYTDGTTSMSLAQWSIENTVSQTSDTEAVVIDRSSGAMKRVRRV